MPALRAWAGRARHALARREAAPAPAHARSCRPPAGCTGCTPKQRRAAAAGSPEPEAPPWPSCWRRQTPAPSDSAGRAGWNVHSAPRPAHSLPPSLQKVSHLPMPASGHRAGPPPPRPAGAQAAGRPAAAGVPALPRSSPPWWWAWPWGACCCLRARLSRPPLLSFWRSESEAGCRRRRRRRSSPAAAAAAAAAACCGAAPPRRRCCCRVRRRHRWHGRCGHGALGGATAHPGPLPGAACRASSLRVGFADLHRQFSSCGWVVVWGMSVG